MGKDLGGRGEGGMMADQKEVRVHASLADG